MELYLVAIRGVIIGRVLPMIDPIGEGIRIGKARKRNKVKSSASQRVFLAFQRRVLCFNTLDNVFFGEYPFFRKSQFHGAFESAPLEDVEPKILHSGFR
jgi:hypothetical protein